MLSALSTGRANAGELGAAEISVGGVDDLDERETELCVALGEGCSKGSGTAGLALAILSVSMET